jgi:hypothetical protein
MAKVDSKMIGYKNYEWAYNKLKLKNAYNKIVEAHRVDPSVIDDEETMKSYYVELKGLLTTDQEIVAKTKRPRSTSNVDR